LYPGMTAADILGRKSQKDLQGE